MRAALALAALLGAAHEAIRISSPASGWTAAPVTHVVAQLPAGDDEARLDWLGWSWSLLPAPDGRVSAWLPLLEGWNELSVTARSPNGRREGSTARLWRQIGPEGADDLVVVAGWPAGAARLDLRITDPAGEACDASNRRTRMGGWRLRDDPEAPGPHVFMLPQAAAGEYHVSLLCGRLVPGAFVPVHALAILFPGTPREERFDLSGVVGRCDIETDLGTIDVIGRLPGVH
ncbi:MAG TPA: hypothetical protein VMB50_08115 [Myxococcales bacterium]|nr:hypothetical protein [Myxococcales bacterium]